MATHASFWRYAKSLALYWSVRSGSLLLCGLLMAAVLGSWLYGWHSVRHALAQVEPLGYVVALLLTPSCLLAFGCCLALQTVVHWRSWRWPAAALEREAKLYEWAIGHYHIFLSWQAVLPELPHLARRCGGGAA